MHAIRKAATFTRNFISAVLHQARSQKTEENSFSVFLTPDALAINKARQSHLASLGLDLSHKRVLEIGAGIGLHTPFFLERGCDVVVTDGNRENVEEIRRRHPKLRVEHVDLEENRGLRWLGDFDVVYCYGLLYHLADPERAIAQVAEVCRGQMLLETCVSLGSHSEVIFLRDFHSNNQAVSGIGCRPTRSWVRETLQRYFGFAYLATSQPDHPDFPTNWDCPDTRLLYRGVFVGSKVPIENRMLTTDLPSQQLRFATG